MATLMHLAGYHYRKSLCPLHFRPTRVQKRDLLLKTIKCWRRITRVCPSGYLVLLLMKLSVEDDTVDRRHHDK